ncbi:Cytoplasmic tRNA 2-thiolation protein 2 [Grifola frondosa]|uniref:Cytoplasmic tRNA 2-thiolation protein 2 n=1 Tax=Grifola frondosa TaxID=5627 RepID=A0A1C7M6F1_GRIFR|nr:Cytoplasmic tRNA 2-thiolation protein 2 [Grifola frondosa]
MSCGNPTDAEAVMQRRPKHDKTKICVRCKVARGNLVIRHAVYCKDCFFPLVTHRFRRALEPSVNSKPDGPRRTALKPSGNLLLGYSGGLGSAVLLDLVHRCYIAFDRSTMQTDGGRDHPRHERVWKKVTVCYVEVCDAFPGMKDRSAEIAEIVARYEDFEFISLRIQDAFNRTWWEKVGGIPISSYLGVSLAKEDLVLTSHSSPSTPLESLHTYLSSLPTPTAVSSSIQTLTRLLLLHTALQTASSHLLLGTSLTSLAISLISGISQGAGFNVREEIQEEWAPDGTEENSARPRGKRRVRIVRPLRDVGAKECAAWLWWRGLSVVGLDRRHASGASLGIGELTKDFITGLEKDYPSTVSTIVRTCGKLAPKGDVAGLCVLCERPAQAGVQLWKARTAIREPVFQDTPDRGEPDAPLNSPPSLAPHLCYACHATLTSRRGTSRVEQPSVPLPVWTSVSPILEMEYARGKGTALPPPGMARMAEQEMKAVVQEFLLDDE